MTQRLGKYEILEEIGRGGFATVYRARDPDLDREVAVKVLDPLLMRDPSLVERFRREARAAARLRHPGIVGIHEISDAEGVLAIAMDLLPGPSLADIAEKEAPLLVERAVELLRPLAEALDYAHAQGLIHRDVKPSNAILDAEGRPVLTDFGLVKAAEESGSAVVGLTTLQSGMTLGTPAYIAPEQADPEINAPADRRADLYSLGVVAYELLTGRVPFEGTTPLAVAVAHLIKAPPPPRELNPALPEKAETALLKMLAKKPEDRFESARAFVAALAAATVQPETALASTPPPLTSDLAVASPPVAVPPRLKAATPPPAARQRRVVPALFWPLAGGAAILLTVLVISVVVLLRAGEGGRETETSTAASTAVTFATTKSPAQTPAPAPTTTLQATATPHLSTTTPLPPTQTPPLTPETPAAGATRTRDTDGMVMVYVPVGDFPMGSTDAQIKDAIATCVTEGLSEADCTQWMEAEGPQHTVTLDAFWIDRTEVTNAQYHQCVEAGACQAPTTCDWGEPTYNDGLQANHSVVCVSWNQATAYCQWAGARLPTEAEWEKAARGTDGRIYPWGNTFDGSRLNFCDKNCEYDWKDTGADDGYARTAPVGSFPAGASPYGVLDMAGNVCEWVNDWYDAGYYIRLPGRNPQGPDSAEMRVLRGGAWVDVSSGVRSAYRGMRGPIYRRHGIGFRCGTAATFFP